MSDTPLTDIAEAMCDKLSVMDAIEFAIYHAQKMERELAEANKRIRELEETK
jgi:hydroxypyruvate isomerase